MCLIYTWLQMSNQDPKMSSLLSSRPSPKWQQTGPEPASPVVPFSSISQGHLPSTFSTAYTERWQYFSISCSGWKMDGWIERWMDGQMDGGKMDLFIHLFIYFLFKIWDQKHNTPGTSTGERLVRAQKNSRELRGTQPPWPKDIDGRQFTEPFSISMSHKWNFSTVQILPSFTEPWLLYLESLAWELWNSNHTWEWRDTKNHKDLVAYCFLPGSELRIHTHGGYWYQEA